MFRRSNQQSRPLSRYAGGSAALGGIPIPADIERAGMEELAIIGVKTAMDTWEVRRIEQVTHEALRATANIAGEEAFWMQRFPHAAGRLQAIADAGGINMLSVVQDARR